MTTKVTDSIRHKLALAVEEWAADNLDGKPAILGNCMVETLVTAFEKCATEINESFGDKEAPK